MKCVLNNTVGPCLGNFLTNQQSKKKTRNQMKGRLCLTHRSLLSRPYCEDTQKPLRSSRAIKGSLGYLLRYLRKKPPSKSARTPSMSTRTRSFLAEVEPEDIFPQIFLHGSRSKVDPLPSRRVGRIRSIVGYGGSTPGNGLAHPTNGYNCK